MIGIEGLEEQNRAVTQISLSNRDKRARSPGSHQQLELRGSWIDRNAIEHGNFFSDSHAQFRNAFSRTIMVFVFCNSIGRGLGQSGRDRQL